MRTERDRESLIFSEMNVTVGLKIYAKIPAKMKGRKIPLSKYKNQRNNNPKIRKNALRNRIVIV